MKHFLYVVFQTGAILAGLGLTAVVALQTSRSEGLSGLLAGGGGSGGKVGREKHLEGISRWLAYGWLLLCALAALAR
jgi:protein translocase SecG subunit